MTGGGWLEADSELFASLGEVFTPGREEIERVLLEHVPAERDEPFLAVDVGCGQGWLSEAVLRAFPRSMVLALDGSPAMLRVASELLAPYGGRAELRTFRLEEPAWISGIEGPVRCFLSSLVIHHLDGAEKRELFRRLQKKLEAGGALLYADVVEARSEVGRRHMARAWDEEVRRRSLGIRGDESAYRDFVDREWNLFDHPDPMDKPSGTAEQLRWLEEAGFEGVDAPWARAGHAVFCAYKPAS
jgi:tRNA (cmo5U34)-methyltransferase